MLVDQKVVQRRAISNNFGHAVRDHRNRRVRVKLDVRVSQVLLIERVDKDKLVRHSSHHANGEQGSRVLVEVIAVDCEVMLSGGRCVRLSGILCAAAGIYLSH